MADSKFKFRLGGQVVEYGAARKLLWLLGFGMRREENFLVVYRHKMNAAGIQPCETGGYVPKETKQEPDASLYVDEGYYTGMLSLDAEGNLLKSGMNDNWMELVDATNLAGVIVRKCFPDFVLDHGNFIGRGYTQQHHMDQYLKALATLEHPLVEYGEKGCGT